MATPVIQINNGAGIGSDTAASGAGPTVALTGSSASTNATGLIITLDGSPDLSGMPIDGSWVLWVNTAAGRQFASITGKDNVAKTVSTTTAYTVNLTGQSWAIGGKRATLDNVNTRKLFTADFGTNWVVDFQGEGAVYPLTAGITLGTATGLMITSTATNRPTITTAAASTRIFSFPSTNGLTISHLRFTNTAATRASCLFQSSVQTTGMVVSDCYFGGFTYAIEGNNGAGGFFAGLVVDSCEFASCTTGVIFNNSYTGSVFLDDCFFHDNASTNACLTGGGAWTVDRCVFARNDRPININFGALIYLSIRHSVVQGSTNTTLANAAVTVPSSSSTVSVMLADNIFYGNAATAVSMAGIASLAQRNNAYGANGANRANFAASPTDIALTADPFTAAASNDFSLNATVGGGNLLRGIAHTLPGLPSMSYLDVGTYQHQDSASGPIPADVAAAMWVYGNRTLTG